eukprot:gene22049-28542_t
MDIQDKDKDQTVQYGIDDDVRRILPDVEFIATREAVDRSRKQEQRRQAAEQTAALKIKKTVADTEAASVSSVESAVGSALLQDMLAASTAVSLQGKKKVSRRASVS